MAESNNEAERVKAWRKSRTPGTASLRMTTAGRARGELFHVPPEKRHSRCEVPTGLLTLHIGFLLHLHHLRPSTELALKIPVNFSLVTLHTWLDTYSMRLNRFLAGAGLGSRRSVEELIKEGRVKINGRVVTDLATTVEPEDTVKVGNRVVHTQHTVHAVMNKPRGVVCTADDERGRQTIYDFLPEEWPRVFHVGRLDKESEGLLIVTNDGDLSLALTHPRYKVEKEYEVTLDKAYDPAHSAKLLKGFHIIGGRAKMEEVEQEGPNRIRVVLTQGIKRQIRLMLYELGYEVERLVRVRIGPIVLTKFPPGTWRMLNPKEVAELKGETPAKSRPIKERSALAREKAAASAAARAARISSRRDRDENSRGRSATGHRAPERRDTRRSREEGERRPFKSRFSEERETDTRRPASRERGATGRSGYGERREDKRGFEERERPSSREGARPFQKRREDRGGFEERERPARREGTRGGNFREGREEGRSFGRKPEGIKPRRAPSARSEEGRAPAPRRGGSHDRPSGSGRGAGAGRAGTRPERRSPRSAPRSGKSRS